MVYVIIENIYCSTQHTDIEEEEEEEEDFTMIRQVSVASSTCACNSKSRSVGGSVLRGTTKCKALHWLVKTVWTKYLWLIFYTGIMYANVKNDWRKNTTELLDTSPGTFISLNLEKSMMKNFLQFRLQEMTILNNFFKRLDIM